MMTLSIVEQGVSEWMDAQHEPIVVVYLLPEGGRRTHV